MPTGSSRGVQMKTGRWSDEEHNRFIEAVRFYGKDWRMIAAHIETRTVQQITSRTITFKKMVQKDPNTEGADIVDILNGPAMTS